VPPDALASAFLAALDRPWPTSIAGLESELRARVDAGRAAWPALALDEEAFVRHLAACSEQELPPEKHAGDLWLACACLRAVPGAVAAFEKAHGATVERAASRVTRSAVDEVRQAVMVALFVSEPDKRPRIAEYAGRAALRTWVATVTANAALNLVQRRDQQPHESIGAIGAIVADVEPELALVRARHGAELEAALRAAVTALDKRARVLLRLHHVQGWTLDRLATMYRTSRSSVGRQVALAREALLDDTKRRLQETLDVTPSELKSLLDVLRSSLEVSLVRMLDTED
jgi:RNA polymerase sigma-70 factor (ECF subfamily)